MKENVHMIHRSCAHILMIQCRRVKKTVVDERLSCIEGSHQDCSGYSFCEYPRIVRQFQVLVISLLFRVLGW